MSGDEPTPAPLNPDTDGLRAIVREDYPRWVEVWDGAVGIDGFNCRTPEQAQSVAARINAAATPAPTSRADRIWGEGNWIVCEGCPNVDVEGVAVRHHKNFHRPPTVTDTDTVAVPRAAHHGYCDGRNCDGDCLSAPGDSERSGCPHEPDHAGCGCRLDCLR